MAGPEAYWKGILLGLFCIALGVIIEIIINNIYNRKNKWFFNAIISVIPLLTLFMFVGMGVLRSAAVNATTDPDNMSENIFPPWTVNTFFIGMSLAAPTALGCVLFIIQKKFLLLKQIRLTKSILQKTGTIINSEQLLQNNKTDYAKDLSAEYDLGFHNGCEEELFKEPAPKKIEPAPAPQGSLVEQLKAKMLSKFGTGMVIIISSATLLYSCNGKESDPGKLSKYTGSSIIFYGVSGATANKVLERELANMKAGTAVSVIWPDGIQAYEMPAVQESSLVAKPIMDSKSMAANKITLEDLKKDFRTRYKMDVNMLSQNWRQESFQLIALVAEQFQENFREKRVTLWMGLPPVDLLAKTDSLITVEARGDVKKYLRLYSFNSNRLAGSVINIHMPVYNIGNNLNAEALRRTRLYYRELFSAFDAVVLSANTVNI
jgi:hypothetical protein